MRLDIKHSTINRFLLLWLIETDVFQLPQLHKHFNVARKQIDHLFIMKRLYRTLVLTLLLFSCGQQAKETDSDTVKEGNKTTTLSTDTVKLSKLIDISTFKPTHAKFKYTFIDNSGQNERLSVPGPSDSYLQAVLYFDTTTFRQLKTKYFNADYSSPNYDRNEFNFEWLDTDIKNELLQTDTSYHGHPDYFLGLGVKGKLWFLNNKVLLTKTTD
jgi:hypothetical protein